MLSCLIDLDLDRMSVSEELVGIGSTTRSTIMEASSTPQSWLWIAEWSGSSRRASTCRWDADLGYSTKSPVFIHVVE